MGIVIGEYINKEVIISLVAVILGTIYKLYEDYKKAQGQDPRPKMRRITSYFFAGLLFILAAGSLAAYILESLKNPWNLLNLEIIGMIVLFTFFGFVAKDYPRYMKKYPHAKIP